MSDGMANWLLEQIAEDERITREEMELRAEYEAPPGIGILVREFDDPGSPGDPARVLAECAAKRRIVAAYLPPGGDPHPGLPCINFDGQDPADYDEWDTCRRHVEASKTLLHHDYVLRLLALPYADRPGYLEEWRP